MASSFVAVAGAAGALGKLIAAELRKRNVAVKALVRPGTAPERTEELRKVGATIAEVDLSDKATLTSELTGATCVVSTLQGLRDVIFDTQGQLLDAAVAAKVPRFIPSDFSLDFTKTRPGSNRNLDFRREFHARLDASGIAWTSILNGGFMELLAGTIPLINRKSRKVSYVGSPDQKIDFTTMSNTAAFTAAAAADPNPTPKVLRIAGDVVSARDIAAAAAEAEVQDPGTRQAPQPYSVSWMGSVWFLEVVISVLRWFGGENQVFPAWQGMQYMANQFSGAGKLEPLDNDRYPELTWTKVVDFLREHNKQEAAKK
jgi:uncharacterized protein YbjT (DUF2867 family)